MSERFVSYSQNGEDVVLWRALNNVSNGFYVDVGAGWPLTHSVTKAFSLRGWKGINVEPNPEFHASLIADRPNDINLQIGVSDMNAVRSLFLIEDTGLSTFDPKIAAQHSSNGWSLRVVEVETRTLEIILDQHLPDNEPIHFLKIDAEGLESEIIRSNNWSKYRPWIVVCESTAPLSRRQTHRDWEQAIVSNGYIFSLFDGLNRYYIAEEQSFLMDAVNAPANPLDDFVTYEQESLRKELEDLRIEYEYIKNKIIESTENSESFRAGREGGA